MNALVEDGEERQGMPKASAIEHWPAHVVAAQQKGLQRRLARTIMKAVGRYKLIEPGDKILVAISGGKDSYTLLDYLWQAKPKAPFEFDLVAVHLDQDQPGYDGDSLVEWLSKSGIPHEILKEDTYSVVKEKTKEGGTYCSLCSRLRRGILYSAAQRLGCNKIALGHHRDDALETLLMNLFYAGKMQAMPAKYTTDDGAFEVIRPLIECAEKDIALHAERAAYPILPCNLCGSQSGLKREKMTELLTQLEGTIPDVRSVMLHALQNVRPSHRLDPDVMEAWEKRPEDIRPRQKTPRRTWSRHQALPVIQGGGATPAQPPAE
jgi:tRNA 2-thiocytidine biosynthesis protein TtcA